MPLIAEHERMDIFATMTRSDWNLLVVAAAAGQSMSPVQLQKCLFLIGKNIPGVVGHAYYSFVPYNYGPYCPSVYLDAERLEREGAICVARAPAGFKEFSATPSGLKRAEAIRHQIPAEVVDYVDQLVSWARSLSFSDLVRAIYNAYPDYRVNSVFVG